MDGTDHSSVTCAFLLSERFHPTGLRQFLFLNSENAIRTAYSRGRRY